MEINLLNSERIEELFLNGVKIIQSENLYRFTSDAVLLTRFARAKKNEILADFCSGSGIVGLHFYALHPEVVKEAPLFELQAPLAEMSERSVALNNLTELFTVHNTPLQNIGREFNDRFTLILCNPPYEKDGKGEKSYSESDRIARHEVYITLDEIVKTASEKLRFGGRFCISHRTDRLVDVICAMRKYSLEPKRIKFACPKNKEAYLVFVEGVKGGRQGVKIESPFEN